MLVKIVEDSVPKRLRRKSSRPLWMQPNVMRTIRKKKRLWSHYCTTQDYQDYQAYQNVKSEVNKAVKRAKKNFERKIAKNSKKNAKPFYSYVNSMSNSKSKDGPLRDANGNILMTECDMAKNLNETFASVFTNENKTNMPELKQHYN
ncbi:MAG: hypothetical protein GY928_19630, partial [Colwellia sp.]|nr:hypothetical protein [Colwellia sp.]